MNRIAVYTVLTNNYDNLVGIKREDGCDYFVLTDNDSFVLPEGWGEKIIIEKGTVKTQRKYKILGHEKLRGYDTLIYLDANMEVRRPLKAILPRMRHDVLFVAHNKRSNLAQEAEEVIRVGKDKKEVVERQMTTYPDYLKYRPGLYATGFMIRKNTEKVRAFNKSWWEEVKKHSHRDQLSQVIAIAKHDIKVSAISFPTFNLGVRIQPHKHFRIYYSTPYSPSRDIGGANNEFIKLLPDDAWVCITDGDAMFLRDHWGDDISNVVRKHGHEFQLIGCTTNRLGHVKQLYNKEFSEEMSMREHHRIAEELWDKYTTQVDEIDSIAGVFMLFNKSTWEKVGGFKPRRHDADTQFSLAMRKHNFKIGIARGIYMMHAYRITKTTQHEALADTVHLRL